MPKGIKKQYIAYGWTTDNRKLYYMSADDGFTCCREFAKVYPDLQSVKEAMKNLKRKYTGKGKSFMVMGYEPV